jgi:transposase
MFYGLDVHRLFIQVCKLDAAGKKRGTLRVDATVEAISAFAQTLCAEDQVVLEATFHTWAIHALLVPHAGRVVVANPLQVKAIAHAKVKTDKVDAHILAQLLRVDFIPAVVMPDEKTWELRQLVTHRQLLGKQRTAIKNSIQSLVHRKLLHCPHHDIFVAEGREWLQIQDYTVNETFILKNSLALLGEIQKCIRAADDQMLEVATIELDAKLLMTLPGVDVRVAVSLLAAIGDIARFPSPDKLTAYFGLVPRVSQSADRCHHGGITKQGKGSARWLAIEAAQSMVSTSAPLTAVYHRIKRKSGHNVAVVALARKLLVIAWHLLRKREPYRYAPVARTRKKLRRVTPGVPAAKPGQIPCTIERVYQEVSLPLPDASSAAERRVTKRDRRTVTLAKKRRAEARARS